MFGVSRFFDRYAYTTTGEAIYGYSAEGALTIASFFVGGAATAGKIGGVSKATSTASSTIDGVNLAKSLASRQQMGEAGRILAGPGSTPFTPFRDASRVANTYGGQASSWVKRSSSNFEAPNITGNPNFQLFETHWVENTLTRQQFEFKTKFPRAP